MIWDMSHENYSINLHSTNLIKNYIINNICKYEQGPPDLENIIRKFSNKILSKLINKKIKTGYGFFSRFNKLLIVIVLISIVAWIVSGFYIIKETERGVVNRFGRFSYIVGPGLNWRPLFVDNVRSVNVEAVRELATSGLMLTADENVVRVEMNVQYRISNPKDYLYSVVDAEDSLRQATDSALRGVIGRSTMDRILTEGRTVIRSETQKELEETICPYHMGIMLLDVNFQTARPPEEVKAAFDDAIAARENREQYVREAEAYANEVQPRANGQAQRILEEARAYRTRVLMEAKGEIARFTKILPQYKSAPDITRERLYIETMEYILSHTQKVLVNIKDNNLTVLSLNHFLQKLYPKTNNKNNNNPTNLLEDNKQVYRK